MSNNNQNEQNDNKKSDIPLDISAIFIKPEIRIYGENKFYYYDSGYYGNKFDDYLELSFEEALLLAERGRIQIFSVPMNSFRDFQTFLGKEEENYVKLDINNFTKMISTEVPNFWGRYLVYKDLRSRGYVVRPGYGTSAPYRRYPRGAKAEQAQSNALVYPFVEGNKMELFELEELEEMSHANRKTLILGIVDRSGDVTYYKASEFVLNENVEQYKWIDEDQPEIEEKKDEVDEINDIEFSQDPTPGESK
jgi:tRNA-intron endonuclease